MFFVHSLCSVSIMPKQCYHHSGIPQPSSTNISYPVGTVREINRKTDWQCNAIYSWKWWIEHGKLTYKYDFCLSFTWLHVLFVIIVYFIQNICTFTIICRCCWLKSLFPFYFSFFYWILCKMQLCILFNAIILHFCYTLLQRRQEKEWFDDGSRSDECDKRACVWVFYARLSQICICVSWGFVIANDKWEDIVMMDAGRRRTKGLITVRWTV